MKKNTINLMRAFVIVMMLSSCHATFDSGDDGSDNNPGGSTKDNNPATEKVATPVISPVSGIVDDGTPITIYCDTSDAAIYYTLNDSDPTELDTLYDPSNKPLIDGSITIRAKAFKTGNDPSDIASATYSINVPIVPKVETPSFTPDAGAVARGTLISMACSTENAVIRYTTGNGSQPEPTVDTGDIYDPDNKPAVNAAVSFKIKAFKDGYTDSDTAVVIYSLLLSSADEITNFYILGNAGTKNGTKITVVVPYGSDLAHLTPTIEVSALANVNPATNVERDFTDPVHYIVTAEDNSTQDYTMTVISIGPAGGWIFYDKGYYSEGWRYLEAATSDVSAPWYNGTYVQTHATATDVGTGQANTTTIVAVQGPGYYDAALCDSLVFGGKSDWFLPSRDEMSLIYTNMYLNGIGNLALYGAPYWTSSEATNWSNAWNVDMSGSEPYIYFKYGNQPARCIRAF